MDRSRLKSTGDEVEGVAVAIGRNEDGCTLHAGIAYRDLDDRLMLLHFGWHRRLFDEPFEPRYRCVVPDIDPLEMPYAAEFCNLVAKSPANRGRIPYAIGQHPLVDRIDPATGAWLPKDRASGVTCATFVLVVFDAAGFRLLDSSHWPVRAEDRAAVERLAQLLEQDKDPDRVRQGAVVRGQIEMPRIRPEEVAGACLEDIPPPAGFAECERNGKWILEQLP